MVESHFPMRYTINQQEQAHNNTWIQGCMMESLGIVSGRSADLEGHFCSKVQFCTRLHLIEERGGVYGKSANFLVN
jgi:hypothetical protein